MKYAGDNGVAAYGVVMYVGFILVALFIGYSIGSAPIISYNFGAENRAELKNVFRKSNVLILSSSAALTVLSFVLAEPLSYIFVGYDKELLDMTVRGFRIFSFSFLFCGMNIYGSAFFTALNNGVVSALISFLRTCLFQCVGVLVLPLIFSDGLDGIWASVIAAEALAFAVTALFLILKKKKYGYM
jgi:Na+-driven multidrug efflux pump